MLSLDQSSSNPVGFFFFILKHNAIYVSETFQCRPFYYISFDTSWKNLGILAKNDYFFLQITHILLSILVSLEIFDYKALCRGMYDVSLGHPRIVK